MNRQRFVSVAIATAVVLGAVVCGDLIVRLPVVPYNVKELMGGHPSLELGVLSLALMGSGALPMALALMWLRHPYRFAKLLVPIALGVGTALFFVVYPVIPAESIEDVLGTPVLHIGRAFELWFRFLGFFIGPVIGITLGSRLGLGKLGSATTWIGGAVAAALLYASYVVVVTFADTSNIVELLRSHGGVAAGAALCGYCMALGLVITVAARGIILCLAGRPRGGILAVSVIMLGLPVAWMLLLAATNPRLDKYGKVFSARQFLFSPDRDHYLDDRSIAKRFAIAETALSVLLTSGGLVVLTGATGARDLSDPVRDGR